MLLLQPKMMFSGIQNSFMARLMMRGLFTEYPWILLIVIPTFPISLPAIYIYYRLKLWIADLKYEGHI
jgi:hypothetical protein